MNEEQMNRRFRRMSRFVIIVGLLLLITGILFVLFLLNTMKDAALDQMRVETQEYNKRLYDQIDADYQIINTFTSPLRQLWTKDLQRECIFRMHSPRYRRY